MKQNRASETGLFNSRVLVAFIFSSLGALLAMISVVEMRSNSATADAGPVICDNAPPIPGNERCPLWQSRYSNPTGSGIPERAQATDLSPDGLVVYVTGPSHNASTNLQDAVTVAYSSIDGHQLWSATHAGTTGTYGAYPAALAVSPDGQRVYVTGQWDVSLDFTTSRFGTVAYNALNGAEIWAKTFQDPTPGFDYGNAIAVAPDSATVFVTGNSTAGYRTIAYSTINGNVAWNSTFPGTDEQGGEDLELSPDGTRIYVIGTTPDILGSAYGIVAYEAATGAQAWAATYRPPECSDNQGYALAVGPSGDIFATGFVNNCLPVPRHDYGTAAFNANGALRWSVRYAGNPAVQSPQYNSAYRIAAAPTGARVYVSGFSAQATQQGTALIPIASTGDYATLAYNVADGSQAWASRYDGGAYDGIQGIAISPDGARLYVTGFSQRSQGFDWATVAYNNAGAQQFVARYHGSAAASSIEQGNAMVVSPDNTQLYVAGQTTDASGASQDFGTLAYDTGVIPLTPISAVSRKMQGSGVFNINLPRTGNAGVEPRSGGTAGDYQMIVTFATSVTCNSAELTSGAGSVSTFAVGSDGTEVNVNLTGIANAQRIVVRLNVSDGTNTKDVVIPMSILIGDSTADGSVNASDISQIKAQSGRAATASNFRQDVTSNGVVNSSDISLVKSKSGTAIQ